MQPKTETDHLSESAQEEESYYRAVSFKAFFFRRRYLLALGIRLFSCSHASDCILQFPREGKVLQLGLATNNACGAPVAHRLHGPM